MSTSIKNYSKRKIKLARRSKAFFKQSTGLALETKLQLHRHWKIAPTNREIYGMLIKDINGFHNSLMNSNLVLLVSIFPRNGAQLREIRTYLHSSFVEHYFFTKRLLSLWRRLSLPVAFLSRIRATKLFVLFPKDTEQLLAFFREPMIGRYGRVMVPLLLRIGSESLAVNNFQNLEKVLLDRQMAIGKTFLPLLSKWRFFLQGWKHSLNVNRTDLKS